MNDYSREEQEKISVAVNRFEKMIRLSENYFFDHEELEKIIEHYMLKNLHQKAMKVIRFAKDQYPSSGVFILRKSQVLSASGKFKEALVLLEKLDVLEPGNPEIPLTRGGIFSMLDNPQKSINYYKEALALDPSIEDAYLYIAIEYQHLKKHGLAIKYLKKCLLLDPENETALFEIFHCFDQSSRLKAGVQFFNLFLDEYSYNQTAWYCLGYLLSRQHDHEKAIEAFDYALLIDDAYGIASFSKANSQCALERYEDAIVSYNETLKINGEDAYVHAYLGECYEHLGQFESAKTHYQQSIDLDENISDAWIGMAVVMDAQDKTNEALFYVQKAISLDPDRGSYWYIQGDLQLKKGDIASAVQSYQMVIDTEPENEEIWISLSNVYLEQGNIITADALMRSGMEFHKDKARFLYQYCEVLLRSAKTQEALTVCEEALVKDYHLHEKIQNELTFFNSNQDIRRLIETYRQP